MQDAAETDVDGVDLPLAVLVAREKYIGNSRESMASNVDDLCVEYISNEQQFIVAKVKSSNFEWNEEGGCVGAQNDGVLVELLEVVAVEKDTYSSRACHQSRNGWVVVSLGQSNDDVADRSAGNSIGPHYRPAAYFGQPHCFQYRPLGRKKGPAEAGPFSYASVETSAMRQRIKR